MRPKILPQMSLSQQIISDKKSDRDPDTACHQEEIKLAREKTNLLYAKDRYRPSRNPTLGRMPNH